MKILCVSPGADFSVSDVERGLIHGLESQGVEIVRYRLDWRITRARGYLDVCWRKEPERGKPTWADVLYLAGSGVLEMALRHQVDWVLVVSGMFLVKEWLVLLRRAGLKTALLLTESPYDADSEIAWAAEVDVVWTNERTSVPLLKLANRNTRYLPHAWDPAVHDRSAPIDESVPAHDVVFVGTGFQERIDMLAAADWSGIDMGLYGTWDLLGSRSKLKRSVRGGVIDNQHAAALYRRAKIGLNLYRQSVGYGKAAARITCAESLNPRAYELAALGVYTVSDWRAEMWEVFGYPSPVATFRTAAELEDVVRIALGQDALRAKADRLPALVAGHTWGARASQVLSDLAEFSGARERQIVAV